MSDDYLSQVLAGARPVWDRQRRNLLVQDQPACQMSETASPFVLPESVDVPQRRDSSNRLGRDIEGAAVAWLIWRLIQRLRTRRLSR